ncbi:MAG: hypothetical protein JW748_06670 [Anaerolineales bacterium]|nr:hypothetical protein [Anaerolineales bacterium]
MILQAFPITWVFGRAFSVHTGKEWFTIPVPLATIVASKLVLLAIGIQGLTLWIFGLGIAGGGAVEIPGGSPVRNE